MGNKFIVSLDQKDLEWRFSQNALWPDFFDDVVTDRRGDQREKLAAVIEKLPPREKDIVRLYYEKGKDQRDIGVILNITQGDVSYRLKRAIKRIKFMLKLPNLEEESMRLKLLGLLPNEQYVSIMIGIYKTSSQSAVAKEIGLSQGKIRYRFLRGLEIIQKNMSSDAVLQEYFEAFSMISGAFNICRELESQERWQSKFMDSCS